MLKTVEEYIDSLKDIPFSLFYKQYIMEVQDENIDKEVSYLLHSSQLNVLNMSALIDETAKAVKYTNGELKWYSIGLCRSI